MGNGVLQISESGIISGPWPSRNLSSGSGTGGERSPGLRDGDMDVVEWA